MSLRRMICMHLLAATLMLLYSVLVTVRGGVQAGSVPYTDCHRGCVKNITISGCDFDKKCVLKNNRNLSAVIDFIPRSNHTELIVNIKATILGLFTISLFKDEPLCGRHNIKCPLVAGRLARFRLKDLNLQVTWSKYANFYIFLHNVKMQVVISDKQTGKRVACLYFTVTVVQ